MIQPAREQSYDAVIIGAGPAGTSVARILAEKGRRVVMLERETFPRYKIGESLIPYCWFPLNRLGMLEKLRKSNFVNKYSVQFVGRDGRVSTPFYFSQHTEHDCANTWQVTRSIFDQMLLDNALEAGAQVMMQTTVRELLRAESGAANGVRAQRADGSTFELHAPIVVDASGRDMFSVARHEWKVPDPQLKKIAIWTYYKGAKRDPGMDEGATTVAYVADNGWFWYIPQENDVVSVGVVAERDYLYRGPRDPDAIFAREVEDQPWVKDHLSSGTKMGPCKVTGDYSYRSRYSAADGLVLVGDAFAFLDPVFSSGVFLALHSGVAAADAIDEALVAGDTSAARFAEYGEQMCRAVEAMRRLVYAFYDTDFSFRELFKKYPELRADVTDCLIGNLYKDFDPLWSAMSEFADLPEPLKHGRAMARAEEVGPRA